MLAKLQEYKLVNFFNHYDKDRNGTISKDEFVHVAYTLAEIRGRTMSDPRSQHHLTELESWWQNFCLAADTDNDQQISQQEWLTFWGAFSDAIADEAIAGGNATLSMLKESVKMTYAMLDADGDQQVTLHEFQQWATATGIQSDHATIFARIDTNGDGYLTLTEATQILKEFYLSNDPEAPGNHVFGLLY